MANKIKEFVEKYNLKKKNDKDFIDNPTQPYGILTDFRDRVTFFLTCQSICPAQLLQINRMDRVLITLDQEDIEYFHKKYAGKIKEEMDEQLAKVKEQYKEYL